FLFTAELGTGPPEGGVVIALTDHEIASRLALALCDTLPDEALLAAAEAGELHEPAQIAAHADRLFASECARRAITRFYEQWLGLGAVDHMVRDAETFPELDDALRASMRAETA